MAIGEEQIRACYEAALQIRRGETTVSAARDRVMARTGLGRASTLDYIYNVQRLLDGRSYTRTMNPRGTELILEWIGADFGAEAQRDAAVSVLAHVVYYRALPRGGPQTAVRDRAEAVLARHAAPVPMQDAERAAARRDSFQRDVARALREAGGTRRARLAQAEAHPARLIEARLVFRRNPDVVAETLARAAGRCEACRKPAPFVTEAGRPFLEVHHLLPLADGGPDTVENTLALCPNCHREAHFGADRQRFGPG